MRSVVVIAVLWLAAGAAAAESTFEERVAAARAEWKAMRPDQALALAEGIVRDFPENAAAHALVGEFARTRPAWADRADAALRKAAELAPGTIAYQWALANWLEPRGDVEGANVAYLRIVEGPASAEDAQRVVNLAFAKQRWALLEAAGRKLAALQPTNVNAWLYGGDGAWRQNRIEAAEELFTAAAKAAGENLPVLGNVIRQALGRGLYGAARAGITRALDLRPLDAEAQNMLGVILENQGRLGLAEMAFRRTAELAPGEAVVRVHIGRVLRKTKRYEEAIAELDEALRRNPNLPDAHNERGLALGEQGDHTGAEAALANAARLVPSNAIVLVNHGQALLNLNRFAEAETVLRKALTITGPNETVQRLLDQAVAGKGE